MEALCGGEIVAYPTDTLYGLAVDPRLDHAVERLCKAKGRDIGSGLPLIAGDMAQVGHGKEDADLVKRHGLFISKIERLV